MKVLHSHNVCTDPSHGLASNQVFIEVGGKSFMITESGDGIRIRIAQGECDFLVIKPINQEEMYLTQEKA